MEYLYFIALTLLVVCGAFLQSLIGIGFVMLVAPFLVLHNPAFVPVPMLLIGTFLPLLILWRDRSAISREEPATTTETPRAASDRATASPGRV